MPKHLLGVDNGGTVSKAGLFTPAGSELGALGAAIAAAVACGLHPSFEEAVDAMTRVAGRHAPDAAAGQVYAEKYARYQRVIAALEGAW